MISFRPGPVVLFLSLLIGIFLLLPLVAVLPISFTPKRFLSMPDGAWSLRHYRALLEDPEWGESFLLSLRVGLISSTVACVLATAFAIGMWLLRPRFAGVLMGFVLLPMIAPPVVSALALYVFLTSLSGLNSVVAYDTFGGLIVSHTVVIVPYAVVMLIVALSQIDRRIDLAAQSLGASLPTRIVRVILPNIRYGILGAFFLCFLLSWDEIGVTLFVTSVDEITLPRRMWMGLRDNIDPAVAALSVILIAVVAAAILVRGLSRFVSQASAGARS